MLHDAEEEDALSKDALSLEAFVLCSKSSVCSEQEHWLNSGTRGQLHSPRAPRASTLTHPPLLDEIEPFLILEVLERVNDDACYVDTAGEDGAGERARCRHVVRLSGTSGREAVGCSYGSTLLDPGPPEQLPQDRVMVRLAFKEGDLESAVSLAHFLEHSFEEERGVQQLKAWVSIFAQGEEIVVENVLQ